LRISRTWRLPAAVLAFGLIATACSSDSTDEEDTTEESATEDGGDGGDTEESDDSGATGDVGGETAQQVIDRGTLICGVSGQLAGFSLNDGGDYSGLDVDYCRGVAAAVLGDPDAVEYVDLTAETRFTALQSGEVDLLSRNTTWTGSRDGELGLQFTATTYYDGQGILVNASDPAETVADMDGYSVCVQSGTTTELNLETYFDGQGQLDRHRDDPGGGVRRRLVERP
jgi:general L-amino acid transport system substrate-binding protein